MSRFHAEHRAVSGKQGGRHSWAADGATLCPLCEGSGIVASSRWREKARKGGRKSYLVSLQPAHLSMRERGKRGGRPKALTVKKIERREAAPGPFPSAQACPR
jgi:hypothetical protein